MKQTAQQEYPQTPHKANTKYFSKINRGAGWRLTLHRIMQEEFYAVAFRKKLYNSLAQLQQDLDQWIEYYNHERTHSGRYTMAKHPWTHLRNLLT